MKSTLMNCTRVVWTEHPKALRMRVRIVTPGLLTIITNSDILGWEQVGEIEFTLDHVDFSKITNTVVDEEGARRYELNLEIDIRLSDESGMLVFKILCQGKECGSSKLGFSYS